MALQVIPENPQYVEDTERGIVIPSRMADIVYVHPHDDPNRVNIKTDGVVRHIVGLGTQLTADDETGIHFWPAYASGLDDFLMTALVQGYMISGSPTPVWISALSTLVAKLQLMAGTWVTTVRGKKSPVGKFLEVLTQADDGHGSSLFVQNLIGALNTHNRGAIVAQVPIAEIGFDKWGEYGMEAQPMPKSPKVGSGRGAKAQYYVLNMTPEAFRENRGLWTVDGLTCLPTGNAEYPYYIKKHSPQLKSDVWVAIPKEFGFQMLQNIGPKNALYAGFGQCGTWRFAPYVVRQMAIDRMDWEHLINQPPRGVMWASGLDTPTQFRDQFITYRQEREEKKMAFYPGVFFGGSRGENSKITMIPWMEPPAGYTPEKWIGEVISGLAACFHVNETHLRLRLGEGALTQSGIADSLEAETAIAWMRQQVELAFNYIAPPRVYITVAFKSDRQNRIMVETLREFSLFISRLQSKPTSPDIYSPDEIRAMTQALGLEIPFTENVDVSSTDKNGPEDLPDAPESEDGDANQADQPDEVEERIRHSYLSYPLGVLEAQDRVRFRKGNFVLYRGSIAAISDWRGRNNWVWVRVVGEPFDMLVDAGDLYLMPSFATGHKPVKLAFVPEGDPAPLSESDAQIDDREAAAATANQLWIDLMGNRILTDWGWDPDAHEYYNGDETVNHDSLVAWRNDFATLTSQHATDTITDPFLSGELTLSEWELQMRKIIQDTLVAQYALARGGFDSLGEADWLAIEALLFEQLQRLNIFSTEIALGLLTEGQIRARAEMYLASTVRAFELGHSNSYTYELVLPCYPGDGKTVCRAYCRCLWQITDMEDFIECVWVRLAIESCPDCISHADCPPIIFWKATGEMENADCYIA